MKILRFLSLAMLISLFAFTPAFASSWSLTPTGQLDTAIGDEIAYALTFNSTETISNVISWQLDFQFDNTELTPAKLTSGKYKVSYNTFDAGFGPINSNNGYVYDPPGNIYDLAAFSLADVLNITPGNSYNFATFYMNVIADKTWDGVSDVSLLSQIGVSGIGIQDETGKIWQYGGVDGASVGSPVPIPASVLLLGSGLMGLIGLRRKQS